MIVQMNQDNMVLEKTAPPADTDQPGRDNPPLRVLILSQVYHPDVVSAAQHLRDFAVELARRGHQVRVICSRRGYDDPHLRFARREMDLGVEIIRVPCTGLGKGAKWKRAVNFASFLFSCGTSLLFERRPDVVVALTAPPLISYVGAWFARLKGCRFFYWVMDLNPDEAVAAGWLRAGSPAERILQRLLRFSLRRADKIIVLDHFMRDRILAKGVAAQQLEIIPPWSHDEAVRFSPEGRSEFRRQHGLEDRFVVMYSGNHSPCHPLTTVLDAARLLEGDPRFVFCFVGGGSEFARVRQFAAENPAGNVICLPYQPLEKLAGSLSAADLHVVVMGDEFPGTIHPCKVYNILALGIPFVGIGPESSHLSEILDELDPACGCRGVRHGDAETLAAHIRKLAGAGKVVARGQFEEVARRFSCGTLLPRMIGAVEGLRVKAGARAR